MSVKIDGLLNNYTLITSNRKSVSLSVSAERELIVRAPFKFPKSRIEELIASKTEWIVKQMQRAEILQDFKESLNFEEGREILYLGQKYSIVYDESLPNITLADRLYIPTKLKYKVPQAIEQWYLSKGKKYIFKQMEELCQIHDFRYNNMRITRAMQRWGSCNSNGNICFSWRLIMAPPEVVKYVIIHELVHLKVHDHSKRFWSQVEQLCPNYRTHRKWLKQNGMMLIL